MYATAEKYKLCPCQQVHDTHQTTNTCTRYVPANKIHGMPQLTKFMPCPSQQIHVMPQLKNFISTTANE